MINHIKFMIKNATIYSANGTIKFIINEKRLYYRLKVACFKLTVTNYLS